MLDVIYAITIIRFKLFYNARVYKISILDKLKDGILLLFTI